MVEFSKRIDKAEQADAKHGGFLGKHDRTILLVEFTKWIEEAKKEFPKLLITCKSDDPCLTQTEQALTECHEWFVKWFCNGKEQ